jgi:hypothetical protein
VDVARRSATSLLEIPEWPGTHKNLIIISCEYNSKSEALILRIRGDVIAEIEIRATWESETIKHFVMFKDLIYSRAVVIA